MTFRLDFDALIKFNERYKDYKTVTEIGEDGKPVFDADGNPVTRKLGALDIFNDYLQGKNQYDCEIKILSCACVERELTEAELRRNISWNLPAMKVFDSISNEMIIGSLEFGKKEENDNSKNS